MEYLDKLRGRPNLNGFNLQWCLRFDAKCCQGSLQTNKKQCDSTIETPDSIERQMHCKKKTFLLSTFRDQRHLNDKVGISNLKYNKMTSIGDRDLRFIRWLKLGKTRKNPRALN